ncbi:serine protease gd-like [Bradysia coprophila]|uniref:serine protease gd-like n=1 Tax=Bradysia coprophila TaxID=38358 RepID=UPI00187D93E7|nr:serine protease gd-like [Bradysia coprophila]
MDWHWIYLLCVIFCVCADQYRIYFNPCPHLFQYRREGFEWIGVAQVDSVPLGIAMQFDVILSLPAKLPLVRHPSNPSIQLHYLGAVELYASREDTIQQIRFNQSVRYKIRFPSQIPLPGLVRLSVNGAVLCARPPVLVSGPYVTLIKLEHTLYTDAAAGNDLSGFVDDINSQGSVLTHSKDDNYRTEFYTSQPKPLQESKTHTLPHTLSYQHSTDPTPSHESQTHLPQTLTFQHSTVTGLQHECGTTHAKSNFRHLVVGGEAVKRGAWPWLVAVYLNGARGSSFNCGGILISAGIVVTAAHCLRMSERTYQPHEVVLYLGRHSIVDPIDAAVKTVHVKKIIIHADYMTNGTSYDADIAVVVMQERIHFTELIRPICLWDGDDSIGSVEGQLGTVVGWGRDEVGNILTAEPKKITIPIVSEAECLRSSDTYRYITSQRTFCAGDRDGTGPCNGDSGSGLAFKINGKWMLRGIVSAALADPISSTCNLGEYVVFTDVAKFVGWIKSYMY